MKRIFSWVGIALAGGAIAAACSSSSGHPLSDPLKACALLTACGPSSDLFGGTGVTCELTDLYNQLDPSELGTAEQLIVQQLQCLNTASDCAAVQACSTVPAAQAAVCAKSTMPRCSGNYLVECGQKLGGMTQGQDCGAVGLVCVENANGATCATAACDPNTTKPTCNGDQMIACDQDGGGLVIQSCALSSMSECSSSGGCHSSMAETCSVVGGGAACTGTGASCDITTFKASCDGTTTVTCAGGKVSRVDCSSFDSSASCVQASDGTVSCGGSGTECTDNTPESCANGVITFCMWGIKSTLDCKSYGLSGCTVDSGSMPVAAHCTP